MINLSIDFNHFYDNLVDKDKITVEIQLEAWQNILNLNIGLGENFTNPFRNDNHPGCKLNDVNGVVLLSDYGDDFWNHKSIIGVVKYRYGVDYKKALQIIFYELASNDARTRANNLKSNNLTKYNTNFNFQIYTENRGWRKFDRQFYGYADITRQQLEFEQCFPVSKYWTNSRNNPKEFKGVQITKKDPCYGYKIQNNIKLRFPKRTNKNNKWISNIQKYQIGGKTPIVHNPGELRHIIIKKSLRDYLTVHNCGYNSRFLPNESVYLTRDFIDWLAMEFDLIIFVMDNDARGIASTKRIKDQWQNYVKDKPVFATHLPIDYLNDGITDPFDLAKHHKYGMSKVEFELNLVYEQAEENLYNFENNLL